MLEVDEVSGAARIQAGATGPGLEAQLAQRGLTLRHFPQSFEFSTLGGWIATRAGGHFATLLTHIDDLVESIRAVTPVGLWESRRLPGSGAGISPDRMLLGSEGTLGLITEAWVRVRPRPDRRASTAVRFADFAAGAEAVRAISQSGLYPANCRLIDAAEAEITGAGDGTHALLMLGFESAHHEVEPAMALALEVCAEHDGTWERRGAGAGAARARSGAGAMRSCAPPTSATRSSRSGCCPRRSRPRSRGTGSPRLIDAVRERVTAAVHDACGAGTVTRRFTHVYPDGPAPYYTVLAPARRGEELAQWAEVKRAAGDAVIENGGTITHHHAVGRDHRPWYDRQRPDPFAAALRAAKAAVDPGGALNPGVLIDP